MYGNHSKISPFSVAGTLFTICAFSVAAAGLAGCCNCLKADPKPLTPLPAAITLQQQLDQLNERSLAIPRLKAIADSNGVEFFYITPDGQSHNKSLDGKLTLEQTPANHSANLLLEASVLNQNVFLVGRNPAERWCVLHDNPPAGFVAPADQLLDLQNALDNSTGASILLLADFIPKVLALTEITPQPDGALVLRVDDATGTNDLLIERLRDDGTAWIERSILIDRRTGNILSVSLFNEAGLPLIIATLGKYITIPSAGPAADKIATPTVQLPRSIVIDCPSRKVKIALRFSSVEIPATLRGRPFETPDWESEGVKVQHLINGAS